MADYNDSDAAALKELAGCNTFDLTWNREVAKREREELSQEKRGYDDKDRYTNRADMHDTKPCERYGKN
ncbi:hypothetical protein AALB16_00380 [Lachnospiraceae bacterium 62-35]